MSRIERLDVIYRHLAKCNQQINIQNSNEYIPDEIHAFKYTLPNNLLSKKQCQFYDDHGYLVIKQLIPHTILDSCSERFVSYCEGKIPVGNMTLMKDISLAKTAVKGQYLYNKMQDIHFDDVFSLHGTYSLLLDYVECFVGPNIVQVHSMLINKPPDAGTFSSIHPFHQDLHYLPFRPANRAVATWTAIEQVTVNNGCLIVLPGTHKEKLQPHDYPKQLKEMNKLYYGIEGFDSHPSVALEMEKGDTVFFHPLLIHGSGPNITKGFRKAISAHYAASECEYIEVHGTTQENIAKVMEEIWKKRGMIGDYSTVWKIKSRLVRGRKVNM